MVCKCPCRPFDLTLYCDIHRGLIHKSCATIYETKFPALSSTTDVFYCSSCLASILPFSDCDIPQDDVATAKMTTVNHQNLLETNMLDFPNVQHCRFLKLPNGELPLSNGPNPLILGHVNIRSIQKNFDDLHHFLATLQLQVSLLCLSETRLKSDPISNISLKGYTFIHSPTRTNAGGVGLYIRDGISFRYTNQYIIECADCEQLWIEINSSSLNSQGIVLAVVYRHPRGNICDIAHELSVSLDRLTHDGRRFFLVGDININLFDQTPHVKNSLI